MKKSSKKLNSKNFITIRIWLANKKLDKGHASLETSECYISIYPASMHGSFLTSSYRSQAIRFASLDEDLYIKKRKADETITLYSLDAGIVNKHYKYFINNKPKFSLLGEKGKNCSSLVAELLQQANIKSLLDNKISSTYINFCYMPTPSNISNVIKLAKKTEELKYPETKSFLPPVDNTMKKNNLAYRSKL